MLNLIFRSFARGYGRKLGYIAARRTSWLAIPILIIVAIGVLAMGGDFLSNLDWRQFIHTPPMGGPVFIP